MLENAVEERLRELKEFFNWFEEQTADGTRGVIEIGSDNLGPIVGITACTHGNEPSGLAAIKDLLDNGIDKLLKRGTIFFIINNPEAAFRYFESSTDEEKRKCRFVDVNMNRLPKNTMARMDDNRYEVLRARELYPIWKKFNVGLDIHSTSKDSFPMIVNSSDAFFQKDLVRGFPIRNLVSNIHNIQIGSPAVGFYGGIGINVPTFVVEAGMHEKIESFDVASKCTWALLKNLGMIEAETEQGAEEEVDEYSEYFIDESVVFPGQSYRLVKVFPDFEPVPAGTLLAVSNGRGEIRAPFDCHTLFCKNVLKQDSIVEEVMFLSKPVRCIPA